MTYVYYAYSWPLYYYVSGIAMYTSFLQSYVEIYHCIILMSGWFFPPGSSLLHFWVYYNVFHPSCISLTSHISGNLLQNDFTHLIHHALMAYPCPYADSFYPFLITLTLMLQQNPLKDTYIYVCVCVCVCGVFPH